MRRIAEFEKTNMEPTFEEALDVCIKYYVDKGYTVEHSTNYVGRKEKDVMALYHYIQEEKKMPQNLSNIVNFEKLKRGR